MTPLQRAEKIMQYICPDTNLPEKDREFIAAQIEEVEREAYDTARLALDHCFNLGFNDAKEKARRIVDRHESGKELCAEGVSDRISKLEAD